MTTKTYTLTVPLEHLGDVILALRIQAAIWEEEANRGFSNEYPVAWRRRRATALRSMATDLDEQRLKSVNDSLRDIIG